MNEYEWIQWLADQEDLLKREYLHRPMRLISDYRREKEITHGYQGREILELIQNGADAAGQARVRGHVRIELSRRGVIAANTGLPFQANGVNSLQTANISPKHHASRGGDLVIGNKGLGFRAILNWTSTPMIHSGSLKLAYTQDYLSQIFRALKESSPELARQVAAESSNENACILPQLAFPRFVTAWPVGIGSEGSNLREIAERCMTLRDEGFDTVVGMPFSTDEAYEHALEQLGELRPEILLFVPTLETMEIEIEEDTGTKKWSKAEPDALGRTMIFNQGELLGAWRVSSWKGEIPTEFRDADLDAGTRFELTIAVPLEARCASNPLFSFFPTEVDLPLPVVCNATLRLEENRKHPTQGRANNYILKQLAGRIADAAEELLSEPDQSPWAACDLVSATREWPAEMKRAGFGDALKDAVREKSIIPTISGEFVSAQVARRVKGLSTTWLPERLFPEVARMELVGHGKMFEAMGVKLLDDEVVAQRISEASDLTLEERALIVNGMLQSGFSATACSTGLLCDGEGQVIPAGVRVFLQPTTRLPSPPDWAKLSFLHQTLRYSLELLLELSDVRELQTKLKNFRVVIYSMDAVISGVVADANQRIKENPRSEVRFRSELVDYLHSLFETFGSGKSPTAFPDESAFQLPNQTGGYRPAKTLYLGANFGGNGAVVQELYGSWAPEKLVTQNNLLPKEVATSPEFLLWLGVAQWPREENLSSVPQEFVDQVMQSFSYPATFGSHVIKKKEDLYTPQVANAKTVDGLDEILTKAEPTAVLTWLANDDRAEGWLEPSINHGKAAEVLYYGKNIHFREGGIPSFIQWRIGNTKWLPINDGGHRRPADCLLGEKVIEALFPRPAEPPVELLQQFGLNSFSLLRSAFRRAGVLLGLSHLDRDAIYGMLLKMPEISPDGAASRKLYRWLLENESVLYGSEKEQLTRFMAEGLMWGAKNEEEKYYPVSELRYLDREGFPVGLIRKLALVDLPKRQGIDKVRNTFGVASLELDGLSQRITDFRQTPSSILINDRFQTAKPFLKKLRQSGSATAQHLGQLDKLKLIVCDSIKVTVSYEGAEYDFEIPEWESVRLDDLLYVRCNMKENPSPDLLADALGMAMANLFNLNDGDGFAKMFRCSPEDRHALLKRMCGEDAISDDELRLASLGASSYWSGPIDPPQDQVQNGEPKGEDTQPNITDDDQLAPETKTEKHSETSGALTISAVNTEPLPTSTLRTISIRRKAVSTRGASTSYTPADGDQAERIALEFEAADSAPRFPIYVGNYTGSEAYGCDILSFSSQEDFDAFKNSTTRDLSKVARFIEVKGRSDAAAKIELSGNELMAARNFHDRYYLYRIVEVEKGLYDLTLLGNPVNAEGAIKYAVYVDLDRAPTRSPYRLSYEGSPIDSDEINPQKDTVIR